ncbi:glycine cleavage system protein H [Lentilactobacillus raoultii]|uniref:Glycine cleavage system protein H n=1 Tax=Lentilactobacillus raoultii TaxID=1987503 RepID=A0ABW3PPD6_9LACO|nr:glycine cleavage system protein H [Lentilactobacillus raoultii]
MAGKIDDSRYFWKARANDGHFKIGLNDVARVAFGEISSVSFATDKKEIYDGDDFITIESPNTVSDTTVLHSPESGEVVKYHTELLYQPHLINSSDREKNWIVEVY